MAGTLAATAALRDPDLPAVGILLGRPVPEPLCAAAGAAAADVQRAEVAQVTWWPGRSITVRYRVDLAGHGLDRHHELVAVAGNIPEGALIVEGEGATIGVWRIPHDPALPGLEAALDPERARRLLGQLGSTDTSVETRLRAYRPGRRAVVEVRGDRTSLFLKLVRPEEVETLHRSHQLLASHVPVPTSLGFSRELGLITLQALPGRTLRRTLDTEGAALPEPAAISALLDALPTPVASTKGKSSIGRLPRIADLLARLVPEEEGRVEALIEGIGPDPFDASVPAHGDFYENQLLVGAGAVVGMLDVDTFGWGRPADDPATMLGHLALRTVSGRHPDRVRAYAGTLLRHWDRHHDPIDLRRRTAAVILNLATGHFRVQRADWPAGTRQRIALAERWLDSAHRVDESDLMAASGSSHGHHRT